MWCIVTPEEYHVVPLFRVWTIFGDPEASVSAHIVLLPLSTVVGFFWNRKSNFFGGMYERLERLCSEGFWVQFTLFSIKWLGLHMPEHVDYVTVFRFPKLHVVVCPH